MINKWIVIMNSTTYTVELLFEFKIKILRKLDET